MKYNAKFYNNISFERYLEKERREHVLASAYECNPRTVLDIGPGLRTYEKEIGAKSYVVVEPNKDLAPILSKSVTVFVCRLENIRLLEKFDMIILSSVLQMVEDCDLFLKKIKSLCHDETLVHINVPNAKSMHRLLGFYMGFLNGIVELSEKDKKYKHKHNFTVRSLTELVRENGFEPSWTQTYMMKPFSDSQMIDLMDLQTADGLVKLTSHFPDNGCEIVMDIHRSY